jgi:hypothetical protein
VKIISVTQRSVPHSISERVLKVRMSVSFRRAIVVVLWSSLLAGRAVQAIMPTTVGHSRLVPGLENIEASVSWSGSSAGTNEVFAVGYIKGSRVALQVEQTRHGNRLVWMARDLPASLAVSSTQQLELIKAPCGTIVKFTGCGAHFCGWDGVQGLMLYSTKTRSATFATLLGPGTGGGRRKGFHLIFRPNFDKSACVQSLVREWQETIEDKANNLR